MTDVQSWYRCDSTLGHSKKTMVRTLFLHENSRRALLNVAKGYCIAIEIFVAIQVSESNGG
jgi:hypothetical protein